ncbi:MAG: DNA polymerase III subunit tau [Alphaproteobacteria bacterium ADurb.Bin438]|nr:MAG: DNA polymerase III subunit tau [Alphaproteobacteria bacterium ADurb.Bin438]
MAKDNNYIVFARKYRPMDFDDLVGQEALVKTLSNAMNNNRLAHAYLLTGIRGVGKTTSARIMAKGLNCIGADGKGGITIKPCGQCSHCKSIMEGRNIDVIEIDAASNTSVDNVREIIEGTKYTPVSARFKIYIIDEVHMLSKSAFNAILKTLEEPPSHVKFIFATTEVKKIPITVLSRCQRFDLKRLTIENMVKHLSNLASKEGVEIDEDALNILATLSEGSARDGVSLLDQAVSHSNGVKITAETIKKMIGIADRTETTSLFNHMMSGDIAKALKNIEAQYQSGVEPYLILNDLLEITHLVTRAKVGCELDKAMLSENLIKSVTDFAKDLNMSALTLVWQMLIKGVSEVDRSPYPFKSLEMLLVRICYGSFIPDFNEFVKKKSSVEQNDTATSNVRGFDKQKLNPEIVEAVKEVAKSPLLSDKEPIVKVVLGNNENAPSGSIKTAFDIYRMAEKAKDSILAYNIKTHLKVIAINSNVIKIANNEKTDSLRSLLPLKIKEWCGEDYVVEVIEDVKVAKSIAENHASGKDFFKKIAMENEIVKAVLDNFEIKGIEANLIPKKDEDDEMRDENMFLLSEKFNEMIDE